MPAAIPIAMLAVAAAGTAYSIKSSNDARADAQAMGKKQQDSQDAAQQQMINQQKQVQDQTAAQTMSAAQEAAQRQQRAGAPSSGNGGTILTGLGASGGSTPAPSTAVTPGGKTLLGM